MDLIRRLWRQFRPSPAVPEPLHWRDGAIRDAWFDAHFHFAADLVAEWLGPQLGAGRTLDFGCGDGITALGLILRHGAPDVLGVDISRTHEGLPKLAQREIELNRLPEALRFQRIRVGETLRLAKPCHSIISWSTFEHIERPYLDRVIRNLHQLLADDGVMFIQINPLFYSPQGSHLGRFQLPPWAHLLWSSQELEQAVLAFEGEIPADELEENFHTRGFEGYKRWVLQEYAQLNRVTAAELKLLFESHGFETLREAYGTVAQEPPAMLLEQFPRDVLVTDELRLLLRKRRPAGATET